jgi:hypothetical protein
MPYKKKPDGIFYDPNKGRIYEHQGHAKRIYWSPQMLDDLRRYFPTTINEECAEIFGVSVRTIRRKARQLGLEKDPQWLREIWDERRMMAQAISKKLGYPGHFEKGHTYGINSRFKKRTNE